MINPRKKKIIQLPSYPIYSQIPGNPKIESLENAGIKVIERVHIEANHNERNAFYMATKFKKMGHLLQKVDFSVKR